MNSLNLQSPIDRGSLLGLNVYRLDDPTGESIYDNYIARGYTETDISNFLNRPLVWKTNDQDLISLSYKIRGFYILEQYTPEQLHNQISLYGAIHTFYDQIFSEDHITKISDLDERNIRNIRNFIGTKIIDMIRINRSDILLRNLHKEPTYPKGLYVVVTGNKI